MTSPLPPQPPPQWGDPPPVRLPHPHPLDQPPKPPWYRRGWFLIAAGLVVGFILGTAITDVDPTLPVSAAPVTSIVERPFFTTDCDQVDNAGTRAQCERIIEGYDKSLQGPASTATTGAPKPKPAPAPTFSDGLYKVGEDIRPGNYRTSGGGTCYYARLKTDDTSSYIANNISSGPMRVTVRSSDGYVELSGGCEWRKVA